MAVVKIGIFVESSGYLVDRKVVRKTVLRELGKAGMESAMIDIVIIGDRKMAGLNKKYRNKEGTTPVLSFSQVEGRIFPSMKEFRHLGDVFVSYPQAREIAKRENKLIGDVVSGLVEHGVGKLCTT